MIDSRIPRRLAGIALALAWAASAADLSFEAAGAPPSEGVSAAVVAAVESDGVRVKASDGRVVVEYWARKEGFSGEPAAGFGIRFDTIPEGAFLALLRFPDSGSDFREQGIAGGLYTLRFGLQPEDGNHMGVAASRDFALMTPAAEDADPAKNFDFEALVEMSMKSGNPHPTIARLELPDGDAAPALWRTGEDHWVLDLKVAGEIIGIVVEGHSEE